MRNLRELILRLETLWQDVRYGARMLHKNPGVAAVAVLTLAVGIGATTAIFSVMNSVLIKPLPYREAEELVWIFGNFRQMGYERIPPNWANELFSEIMGRSQLIEEWARLKGKGFILQNKDEAEHIRGMRASSHLFQMLGVQPVLGRSFLPEENELGRHRVVLLAYDCWQRRFGGDPAIVNKTIRLVDIEVSDRTGQPHDTLAAQSYTVIGVLPPSWQFPMGATPQHASFFSHGAEIWEPESLTPDERQRRAVLDLIVGRLKPNVTPAQAQAEASLLFQSLRKPSDSIDGIELLPVKQQVVGNARSALPLLLGASGLVLLLACLNITSLLLARATVRRKEFAIRSALGAGQVRIFRQLLTESLILAILGSGCGLLLAWWGVQVLKLLGPSNLPRLNEIQLDGTVLGFVSILGVSTGVIFGIAPAWKRAKGGVNEALKDGGRGSSEGFRRRPLQSLLVTSEIALSLVLLVSAGLLINSFIRLLNVNTGYDSAHVLTVQLSFVHPKYSNNLKDPATEQMIAPQNAVRLFAETLLERLRNLPEVQFAALTSWIPVAGGRDRFSAGFHLEGRAQPEVANMTFVTADYFRAMAIPMLRGRHFTLQDLAPDAPKVKIVSESFARKYFPDRDAVGQRFIGGVGGAGEIIGVVQDTLEAGLDTPAEPHIYHASMPHRGGALVVRAEGDSRNLAAAIRKEILAIDKDQVPPVPNTMSQVLSNSVAERRFQTLLLGVFSGVALLLAAIGLYGLMAYTVTRSTREIGVRMAIGAQRSDLLKLVIGRGLKLTLAGLLFGAIGAFACTRILASQLFGVSPVDPVTFLSVSLVLLGTAMLACYLPARRAANVDPMVALRYE